MKVDQSKVQRAVFSLGEPRTLAVNNSIINENQQGTSGLLTDHEKIRGY